MSIPSISLLKQEMQVDGYLCFLTPFSSFLTQVLSKLVVLTDMTQLLGQEALHQAPRVGLGLGHVTEMGKVK